MTDIFDVIREERIKQGISQRELGRRAGVGRDKVSEMECRKYTFQFRTVEKVLSALGLSLCVKETYED